MNFLRTYFLRHPVRTQRALEILPGFVSWSLILFPVWGSFIFPTIVAYYVITFAVYWLYRSVSIAILSILAHFKMQRTIQTNWMNKLQEKFPKNGTTLHHIIVI